MGNRFLLRSIPLLFCLVSPLEAEKSTEPFHVQATRLVVRLEHKITDKERRSTWKPDGSAFFVGTEHGLYIVGARHVVEGKGYDVRARVPSLLEKTGETEVIELRLPNSKWTFHPDNGDDETLPVDVAVMKLPYIKERRIVTFRQCSPCPEGESDQLSGVAEPFDYVVVAGFPRDIGFTLKKPRPFARGGLVGLVAEEKFVSTVVSEGDKKLRKYLQEGAFLVDIEVDPGNSGSPVIVKNPFQSVRLAGLVTGSNPSLDYGIVTPVSQIVETLEHARDADMNKPAWFLLSEDEDSN